MSSDVTLLLHTDRHAVPEAYLQLFARLQPRCTNYSGTHYITEMANKHLLPAADLDTHLPSLLADIAESDRHIRIRATYTLASGADLNVNINCYGDHYQGGWDVRLSGSLAARFELKHIAPPEAGGVQRPPVATHPAVPGHLFTDTEELFIRIAGLNVEAFSAPLTQQTLLQNANFVLAPATCALVHHQTPAQFMHDLATSYVRYKRQMWVPEQLFLTRGNWAMGQSPLDCPPPRKPAPISSRQYVIQDTLLNVLNDDRVRRLVTLPDAVALPLIQQAVQDTAGVRWYDFGDRGAVVSTGDPQVWLWPFYQALLERVVQHLG